MDKYEESFEQSLVELYHFELERLSTEDPDYEPITIDEFVLNRIHRMESLKNNESVGAKLEVERIENIIKKANNMYFAIRHFYSLNGEALVFKINIRNIEKSLNLFLKAHGGTKLVSIEGLDVSKMKTRKEIVANGPEFYLVSDTPKTGKINMVLAYNPVSQLVYEEYVNNLVESFKDKTTTSIINLKTKKEVKDYYKDISNVLEQSILKSMDVTVPKNYDHQTVYKPKEILDAIRFEYEYGDGEGGVGGNTDQFRNNLISNLKKTLGSLASCVFDNLPNYWENILYKGAETERPKSEEYTMVKGLLDNLFADTYKIEGESGPYPWFKNACNNKYSAYHPDSLVIQQKRTVTPRKVMFRRQYPPCPLCYKFECKFSKLGRTPGILLTFSNTTNDCPFDIFNNKLKTDEVFKKRMFLNNKTIKESYTVNRNDIKTFGDVKMINIVDNYKTFNTYDHFINMKNIEVLEDGSLKLYGFTPRSSSSSSVSTENENVDVERNPPIVYHIMKNGSVLITQGQEKRQLKAMEYHTKDFPEALFIIVI